jgi:hypothetical protein
VAQAAVVLFLARLHSLWPLAIVVVAVIELWPLRPGATPAAGRRDVLLERVIGLVAGFSAVLIIALVPRLVSQVVVALLYAVWQSWWAARGRPAGMINLLIVTAAAAEAVFLMAAIWRPDDWLTLVLVWCLAWAPVYATMSLRGERAAGIMAATWALVSVQVSWVLLLWLFTYTTAGGYLLVPQPALVLSALAYCFGSIYVAQREGKLSRGRLTEYLLIGLILIAIVAIGTSWRGSI